jgi:hypothetical protein
MLHLWQDRKCKLPYPQFCVLFEFFSGTKNNVVVNITNSWCMTPCTLSESCGLIEEPDVSIFITAVYRENGNNTFLWNAASYLPSYTASYPKHRSSDHDRHPNVKAIIIFCPSHHVQMCKPASICESLGETNCLRLQGRPGKWRQDVLPKPYRICFVVTQKNPPL